MLTSKIKPALCVFQKRRAAGRFREAFIENCSAWWKENIITSCNWIIGKYRMLNHYAIFRALSPVIYACIMSNYFLYNEPHDMQSQLQVFNVCKVKQDRFRCQFRRAWRTNPVLTLFSMMAFLLSTSSSNRLLSTPLERAALFLIALE